VAFSPPEAATRPLRRAFQGAGVLTFFALGMPDGLLGVAWPAMRRAHHQPASALSILLVAGTAAFFTTTSLSARAAARFGGRPLLIGGSVCAGLGGATIAASPHFAFVVLGCALLSGGAGLVDAVVSSLVSLAGAARLIGVMHSVYAVGAAGAPLVLAAWASSSSWRVVYLLISLVYAALLLVWCLFAPHTRTRPDPAGGRPAGAPVDPVGVSVALATFIAVSGLEIAAGAWAAIYVTDGLHRGTGTGALAGFAFWAALCVARIAAGVCGLDWARAWMVGGSIASVAGGLALWAWSADGVVLAAFALLGAGVGPLLPLLTVLTPRRVGHQAASRVIGWQLAAASVGSALMAGGVGVWVHHSGVSAVPPALALMGVLMTVLVVLLDRLAEPAPGAAVPG
jgi:fucose permease